MPQDIKVISGKDEIVYPFFMFNHCVKRHQLYTEPARMDDDSEKVERKSVSSVILQAVYSSLLSQLSGRKRDWYIKIVYIATENDISEKTVRTALQILSERNLIKFTSKRGAASTFILINPEYCFSCIQLLKNSTQLPNDNSTTVPSTGVIGTVENGPQYRGSNQQRSPVPDLTVPSTGHRNNIRDNTLRTEEQEELAASLSLAAKQEFSSKTTGEKDSSTAKTLDPFSLDEDELILPDNVKFKQPKPKTNKGRFTQVELNALIEAMASVYYSTTVREDIPWNELRGRIMRAPESITPEKILNIRDWAKETNTRIELGWFGDSYAKAQEWRTTKLLNPFSPVTEEIYDPLTDSHPREKWTMEEMLEYAKTRGVYLVDHPFAVLTPREKYWKQQKFENDRIEMEKKNAELNKAREERMASEKLHEAQYNSKYEVFEGMP